MSVKTTTAYTGAAHPPWWTVTETYEHGAKLVRRGDQLTIKGERTVFTFVNHTVAPPRPGSGKRTTKQWITLIGPMGYRSVLPERISRVLGPPKKRPVKR